MKVQAKQAAEIESYADKMAAKAAAEHGLAPSPTVALDLLGPIWQYLEQCEQVLIAFMNGQEPTAEGSTLEWGLVLYVLNNPTQFGLSNRVKTSMQALGMPASRITPAEFDSWETILETSGVVSGDGSIIATTQWNALDPNWTLTLVTYAYYYLFPNQKAAFGTTPQTIPVTASGTDLVLGLMSDWGTGPWTDRAATACPSQAVLAQMQALSPAADVIVHLGDTYYAGLEGEVSSNLVGPLTGPLHDKTLTSQLFTLNANHEMYDGANGYFSTALSANGPFSLQKGTSYFALTYGNAVIVGLDTAYYDTSMLYLDGALTDAAQIGFLKSLDLSGKTVIVLTHHNPLTTTGTQQTSLWAQVVDALPQAPDYWYWGHIHEGIVYSATSAAGTTKARCVGHAALPFGRAYSLQPAGEGIIPSVTYYADTPFPNPDVEQKNRVLNGFAVLTISLSGAVTETFYDQEGNLAWTSDASRLADAAAG